MTCKEFIEMSGLNVSLKDYYEIIEPMYMATDMTKQRFVNFIAPSVKAMIEKYPKQKTIKKMLVRDNSGFRMTPNGCWYNIKYVLFVDIDIASGKYIVSPIDDEDAEKLMSEGADIHHSGDFDFDYTECLDAETKNPVKI